MNGFRVRSVRVVPYTLDAGRPLGTARGPLRFRRGWLVGITDDDGHEGWGDAAAFPGFGSSDEAIGTRLTGWLDTLVGTSFASTAAIDAWLSDGHGSTALEPEVRFAVELALLDGFGRANARSIAQCLAATASERARTHRLVTTIDPDLAACGATTFKLKIGTGVNEDVTRVADLRSAVGPDARIRLDANGGYDVADALRLIERIAPHGIEFLEQPLPAHRLQDMARLRVAAAACGVRIAADEDVSDANALEAVARCGAADVVVLKPMFIGGLMRTRRLALRAAELGLDAIVTHALESAVGRTGTMHLAATLPGVHGLVWSPTHDVAVPPRGEGDSVALPAGPGLGLTPTPATTNTSNASFDPPPLAMPHPVASSAIARPDHPAVVAGDTSLTYRDLRDRVARAASALVERGVRSGDRVALEGPPNLDWVTAFHAIGWVGAVVCPLPHRATDSELAAARKVLAPRHTVDASAPLVLAERPLAEPWWPLSESRVVVATSGTTGEPRAIELTAHALAWNAFGSALRLGHRLDDRWLCPLPVHHVGGLSVLWRCALGATTVVLHERFEAAAVARDLEAGTVTMASLTPTMLARVLDARPARPFPPSLRVVLVGGGPASDALLDRCRELEVPVALTWGMTEAASQIATRLPGDASELAAGLPPLPFHRIEATDEALTVRSVLRGDSLPTADRGRVRNGWVEVLGRQDDAIVHGGETIDPVEIEAVLRNHPSVADAAVVALPSPTHGHAIAAALVAHERPATDEALREHCRRSLAPFKIPSSFTWLDSLPRTSLGKLARASLARSLDQAEGRESRQQELRRGGRTHVAHCHEGMHQLGASPNVLRSSGSRERVGEGDRASADALHLKGDVDAVVQADGPQEIRLGMNERHPDAFLRYQALDVAARREEHLLVRGVAHLVDPPEKKNPCPVDFVEPGRHAMYERHHHE